MTKKARIILFLVGLTVLFFLIRRIGFFEIAGIMSRLRWPFASAGVAVYVVLILMRSRKWFLLARAVGVDVRYRRFLPFYLVNSLMGNLTPFKSGEAATPFLFKKYLGVDLGRGFFVVILDRFFELTAFALFLTAAIFYILNKGALNNFILSVFWTMMLVISASLIFFIIAFVSRKITVRLLGRLRVLRFVEKEMDAFYEARSFFKGKRVYRPMAFLTGLCWACEISAYWLMLNSIFPVSFADALTTQMIAAAGTLLTFIPGGLGVAEAGAVYILSLLKYPAAFAASGVLAARLFLTGTLIAVGLAGLVILERSAAKGAENSEGRS